MQPKTFHPTCTPLHRRLAQRRHQSKRAHLRRLLPRRLQQVLRDQLHRQTQPRHPHRWHQSRRAHLRRLLPHRRHPQRQLLNHAQHCSETLAPRPRLLERQLRQNCAQMHLLAGHPQLRRVLAVLARDHCLIIFKPSIRKCDRFENRT